MSPHFPARTAGLLPASVAFLAALSWTTLPASSRALAASSYEAAFREIAELQVDPARVAAVRDLTLERDAARIELREGQMALLRPIEGRVWGAVFVGKGAFGFRPPVELEREQLRRFTKRDSLDVKLKAAVLLFADTTLVEVASKARFGPGKPDVSGQRVLRKALDLILDTKRQELDPSIGRSLLEGASDETFLAYVDPVEGSEPYLFQIDPFRSEQVRLMRPVKELFFQGRLRSREVLSQFPLRGDLDRADSLRSDLAVPSGEEHYRVHSRFDGRLRLTGETEARFRVLEDGENWLAFTLDPKLQVDSVLWEDGRRADSYKGREARLVWVRADHPLVRQDERTLRFTYHGDVVRREDDWVTFDPASSWFPRLIPSGRATFDLTYEFPSAYTLASVGDPAPIERRGDTVVSRWTAAEPMEDCSFMIGLYKQHRIVSDKAPPVTVLMAESAHRRMREYAGEGLLEEGLAPGKSMEKQVGTDVTNSLAFFQSLYGPTRLKGFYVAENPLDWALGVAYPGLIHLSWTTFYNSQGEGEDQVLRAHEVAHQWWGAMGVLPATYHDRWLSEAFAEFSALCYLQASSKDSERYLNFLKRSRERILNNRKYLFGDGQEAGPIWLGPRTRTSTTEGDYRLVIYDKGTWVLHMLRNLFLDLDTMKDGGFRDMMREFYSTYAGREATTADFQRVVEKYAGRDMSWFFREWVYGTGIPKYRFAWRSTVAEDTRYKVTCRVDQDNVDDDFQMFVPLHVDFGGGRWTKLRVFVKGRHSKFNLPPLPAEPKSIVFNDLESVLCDVESVGW